MYISNFYCRETEILLNLRRRDFAGDYDLGVPMLWDTSEGATARKLKNCIVAHIGCNVALSHLCIAKLHTNQQEWRMIKITKPAPNKKVCERHSNSNLVWFIKAEDNNYFIPSNFTKSLCVMSYKRMPETCELDV